MELEQLEVECLEFHFRFTSGTSEELATFHHGRTVASHGPLATTGSPSVSQRWRMLAHLVDQGLWPCPVCVAPFGISIWTSRDTKLGQDKCGVRAPPSGPEPWDVREVMGCHGDIMAPKMLNISKPHDVGRSQHSLPMANLIILCMPCRLETCRLTQLPQTLFHQIKAMGNVWKCWVL